MLLDDRYSTHGLSSQDLEVLEALQRGRRQWRWPNLIFASLLILPALFLFILMLVLVWDKGGRFHRHEELIIIFAAIGGSSLAIFHAVASFMNNSRFAREEEELSTALEADLNNYARHLRNSTIFIGYFALSMVLVFILVFRPSPYEDPYIHTPEVIIDESTIVEPPNPPLDEDEPVVD